VDESERLLPVDAVRGIAMLFIGVSHISFYLVNDSPTLPSLLRAIGFFASPNFLMMSGLACGYQLAVSPTTATALRIVDRGLFVFLAGHLLVAGSLVYMVPPGTAFEHVVITDTIGVLLCMAPMLRHATARRLLWTGAAVFVLSSLLSLSWHPYTSVGTLLGALLFAVDNGSLRAVGWVTPTIPYMGIFLTGVALGKMFHRFRQEGRGDFLSLRLAASGSMAVAAAFAANVSRHFANPVLLGHFAQSTWANMLLTLLNVRQDAPPTPAYGLFYGGIGIALLGVLGLLCGRSTTSRFIRALRFAAVIGQASFVCYVAQQWLIDFIPIWVGFDSWLTPATSPIYLALTTLLLYWIAKLWGRWKANRYMTLGLNPGSRTPAARPARNGAKSRCDLSRRFPKWVLRRVVVFASVVLFLVVLNALALVNASKLTPSKLALVPPNPCPWDPVKVAGPHG
jgi:uncharacterized membrane protein